MIIKYSLWPSSASSYVMGNSKQDSREWVSAALHKSCGCENENEKDIRKA